MHLLRITLLFTSYTATGVLATAATPVAADEQECGELGVMVVPEGATGNFRLCAGHPAGTRRNTSDPDLSKRDCYDDEPYGCSDGYCWQTCGIGGQWCWLAFDNGQGPWKQCGDYSDCAKASGLGCGVGDCDGCGCGC